jgi:hypothetical protein
MVIDEILIGKDVDILSVLFDVAANATGRVMLEAECQGIVVARRETIDFRESRCFAAENVSLHSPTSCARNNADGLIVPS